MVLQEYKLSSAEHKWISSIEREYNMDLPRTLASCINSGLHVTWYVNYMGTLMDMQELRNKCFGDVWSVHEYTAQYLEISSLSSVFVVHGLEHGGGVQDVSVGMCERALFDGSIITLGTNGKCEMNTDSRGNHWMIDHHANVHGGGKFIVEEVPLYTFVDCVYASASLAVVEAKRINRIVREIMGEVHGVHRGPRKIKEQYYTSYVQSATTSLPRI